VSGWSIEKILTTTLAAAPVNLQQVGVNGTIHQSVTQQDCCSHKQQQQQQQQQVMPSLPRCPRPALPQAVMSCGHHPLTAL
jgi:hypothetical protein